MANDLSRAQATWDTIDIGRMRNVAWSAFPEVSEHFSKRFSANPPGVVREELRRSFPAGGALSGVALVCGDMESERVFFEGSSIAEQSMSISFGAVDGFDLSPESLARVRPLPGFRAHQEDCNTFKLEPNSYHFAVMSHGAHHVMNLSHFFDQTWHSLKPGGLLYFYEWIGPTYLQIPRRNRLVAVVMLLLLFGRKARTTHMGQLKGIRYIQDPAETFDPSEACNSLELRPNITRYFSDLRVFKHGGLLYPVLEGLGEKSSVRKRHRTLRMLCKLDVVLTQLKVIHPLFEVGLVRKRSSFLTSS